ncbi:MAG: glutathione S-transferase family protein [Myxococcota bacterium]|nr:glutathione S-transferase family protein [Myxococcota bacterium]
MISWIALSILLGGGLAWLAESRRRRRHPVAPGLCDAVSVPYEQEFELYHNAFSLCSMKSRLCLAELGLPYRSHPVDLIETGAYENIRAGFLRVNPAGTVPVLVHKGHPVYESHEQIRYAAEHAPGSHPGLIPDDPAAREQMEAWVDRSSLTGDPINEGDLSAGNAVPGLTLPIFATMMERIPAWRVIEGLLFHFDKRRPLLFLALKLRGVRGIPRLAPLMAVHRKSRRQMGEHLDALEARLEEGGGPWILGSFFSLADVSWLVIFERLVQVDSLDVFLADGRRPRCAAYWEALRARPAYALAIAGHAHPIVEYGSRRLREAKAADPALRAALDGEPAA